MMLESSNAQRDNQESQVFSEKNNNFNGETCNIMIVLIYRKGLKKH